MTAVPVPSRPAFGGHGRASGCLLLPHVPKAPSVRGGHGDRAACHHPVPPQGQGCPVPPRAQSAPWERGGTWGQSCPLPSHALMPTCAQRSPRVQGTWGRAGVPVVSPLTTFPAGTAVRHCDEHKGWLPPNLFNCTSLAFAALKGFVSVPNRDWERVRGQGAGRGVAAGAEDGDAGRRSGWCATSRCWTRRSLSGWPCSCTTPRATRPPTSAATCAWRTGWPRACCSTRAPSAAFGWLPRRTSTSPRYGGDPAAPPVLGRWAGMGEDRAHTWVLSPERGAQWDQAGGRCTGTPPGHLLLALLPRAQGAGLGPRGQGDGLPLECRVGGAGVERAGDQPLVLGAHMVPQSQGGAELCVR